MRLRGDDMLDRHRLVLSDPLTGDSERTRSQAFEKGNPRQSAPSSAAEPVGARLRDEWR
jgi:hypothetical protein